MLSGWEHKSSNGKWIAYGLADEVKINVAYLNKLKSVALKRKTSVHFDEMKQMKKVKRRTTAQDVRRISIEDDSKLLIFLWQREIENQWIDFHEEGQIYLNEAVGKGKTIAVFTSEKSNKKNLEVHFETMLMFISEKKACKTERVRCAIYSKGDFYVWQNRLEDSTMACYPPAVVQHVEAAYQSKAREVMVNFMMEYEFDLKALRRKRIITSNILREKIEVNINNGTLAAITKNSAAYLNRNMPKEMPNSSKRIKLDLDDLAESSSANNMTGKFRIDSECALYGNCHIYTEGGSIYDAILNQTSVQNNINEFVIIQLLENDHIEEYSVWFRSGRVGSIGHTCLIAFDSKVEDAKNLFEEMFYGKTKNHWRDSYNFCKVSGKYDLLKMYRTVVESAIQQKPKKSVPKLDLRVHSLLQMICDKTTMEYIMNEIKHNAKIIPLGNLTMEQIRSGYTALNKIADIIKACGSNAQLLQATEDFYTRIPHSFGLDTPPVIRTWDMVHEKIETLNALSEICVAMSLVDEKLSHGELPIDRYYKLLDCELRVLNPFESSYKVIEAYLKNTQGPTHTAYKMELVNVYECFKNVCFGGFKDHGNCMLLWHGTRLPNCAGIVRKGLRMPPVDSPRMAHMFGRGIYFTDISSKSANYCYASPTARDGLLLLCEVSLGEVQEQYAASYYAEKPSGGKSVMGIGRFRPKPDVVEYISGVPVPVGPTERHPGSLTNPDLFRLFYNEYVVYDANQNSVAMRPVTVVVLLMYALALASCRNVQRHPRDVSEVALASSSRQLGGGLSAFGTLVSPLLFLMGMGSFMSMLPQIFQTVMSGVGSNLIGAFTGGSSGGSASGGRFKRDLADPTADLFEAFLEALDKYTDTQEKA